MLFRSSDVVMKDLVEKALDPKVVDEELDLGDFLLDPFPVVGYGLGGIVRSTRRHRLAPITYIKEPTDYTGKVIRFCVYTAPLAFHRGSARGGGVNILDRRGALLNEKPPTSALRGHYKTRGYAPKVSIPVEGKVPSGDIPSS